MYIGEEAGKEFQRLSLVDMPCDPRGPASATTNRPDRSIAGSRKPRTLDEIRAMYEDGDDNDDSSRSSSTSSSADDDDNDEEDVGRHSADQSIQLSIEESDNVIKIESDSEDDVAKNHIQRSRRCLAILAVICRL